MKNVYCSIQHRTDSLSLRFILTNDTAVAPEILGVAAP